MSEFKCLDLELFDAGYNSVEAVRSVPLCNICGDREQIVKHLTKNWVLIQCCGENDETCCNRTHPHTFRLPGWARRVVEEMNKPTTRLRRYTFIAVLEYFNGQGAYLRPPRVRRVRAATAKEVWELVWPKDAPPEALYPVSGSPGAWQCHDEDKYALTIVDTSIIPQLS